MIQQVWRLAASVLHDTWAYYAALLQFLLFRRHIGSCTVLQGAARVHVYSLAKTIQLWDAPHYRDVSFGTDICKNLSNTAIPGTGVPLSIFALSKWTALAFLLFINPLVSLAAAIYSTSYLSRHQGSIATAYRELLLQPRHWFAIWRLNCVLVAAHAHHTNAVGGYSMEDKAAFLVAGEKLGLPVSPFERERALVVKHKSIEGGMGIHVYRNFVHGGDWILQKLMTNSAELAALLPENAPLSTLRIITASVQWLTATGTNGQDGSSNGSISNDGSISSNGRNSSKGNQASSSGAGRGSSSGIDSSSNVLSSSAAAISIVTVVWRAGLAGADTDHANVCFDVDRSTGVLQAGVSAQHWYKLGLQAVLKGVGPTSGQQWTHHPQSGKRITGCQFPDYKAVCDVVTRAHAMMTPAVPLVGWDVALTPEGIFLLELNISCNFFNGSYDEEAYHSLCHRYFAAAAT